MPAGIPRVGRRQTPPTRHRRARQLGRLRQSSHFVKQTTQPLRDVNSPRVIHAHRLHPVRLERFQLPQQPYANRGLVQQLRAPHNVLADPSLVFLGLQARQIGAHELLHKPVNTHQPAIRRLLFDPRK